MQNVLLKLRTEAAPESNIGHILINCKHVFFYLSSYSRQDCIRKALKYNIYIYLLEQGYLLSTGTITVFLRVSSCCHCHCLILSFPLDPSYAYFTSSKLKSH